VAFIFGAVMVSGVRGRHPPPGHNRYLRVTSRKFRQTQKRDLPTIPHRTKNPTVPPIANNLSCRA